MSRLRFKQNPAQHRIYMRKRIGRKNCKPKRRTGILWIQSASAQRKARLIYKMRSHVWNGWKQRNHALFRTRHFQKYQQINGNEVYKLLDRNAVEFNAVTLQGIYESVFCVLDGICLILCLKYSGIFSKKSVLLPKKSKQKET